MGIPQAGLSTEGQRSEVSSRFEWPSQHSRLKVPLVVSVSSPREYVTRDSSSVPGRGAQLNTAQSACPHSAGPCAQKPLIVLSNDHNPRALWARRLGVRREALSAPPSQPNTQNGARVQQLRVGFTLEARCFASLPWSWFHCCVDAVQRFGRRNLLFCFANRAPRAVATLLMRAGWKAQTESGTQNHAALVLTAIPPVCGCGHPLKHTIM